MSDTMDVTLTFADVCILYGADMLMPDSVVYWGSGINARLS